MEETYFSLKFIPIVDSEGATIAHYEPLTETVSSATSLSRQYASTINAMLINTYVLGGVESTVVVVDLLQSA
jgi:hypothetical protein